MWDGAFQSVSVKTIDVDRLKLSVSVHVYLFTSRCIHKALDGVYLFPKCFMRRLSTVIHSSCSQCCERGAAGLKAEVKWPNVLVGR